MLKVPRYPGSLTVITLIYGVFTFFWLSAEDSIWLVSLLGLILALLSVIHAVFRVASTRTFRPRVWIPGLIVLGALVGAGGIIATMLIMLVKTSLHGHLYPDYPFPLISGMAERLGVWTLAGGLVGLALALILYRREDSSS